jgi:hypothetical protein
MFFLSASKGRIGPRSLGVTSVLVAVLGCAPPPEPQPRHWAPIARPDASSGRGVDDPRPAGGSGAPPGRPEDPDPPDPEPVAPPEPDAGRLPTGDGGVSTGSLCTLRVSVTTATTGRDYRPRNIGAIWVVDSGNRFVKTLTVWANRRVSSLAQWGNVTGRAGASRNKVDAVSSATSNNHGTRTGTWNCTDFNRQLVPDGTYRVCFEMTESNRGDSPSRFHCADMVKGRESYEQMIPDEPNFRARRLQYAPAAP